MTHQLERKRLIIVTGKGGTGKTVVSLVLSRAVARVWNRRVLVALGEGLKGLGAAVGSRRRTFARPIRLEGGVYAVTLDARRALDDYLKLRLSRAYPFYRPLLKLKGVDYFFDAAPGLRQLAVLGKLRQLTSLSDRRGRPRFALTVFDAPASGHAAALLRVPAKVLTLLEGGPLRRDVHEIADLMRDNERAALVIVSLPEEMAVEETLETIEDARRIGMEPAFVVLNRVYPSLFGGSYADGLVAAPREGEKRGRMELAAAYLARELRSERYARELKRRGGVPVVYLSERFTARLGKDDMAALVEEMDKQLQGGDAS